MTPKNDRLDAEMPVDGSEDYWRAIQGAVDEHLDAVGNAHLAQLGREYVEAMRSGRQLRELAEAKPYSELKSGRIVSNPLWEASDRDIRRGIQLAKALELTKPRPGQEFDPLAELDAALSPTVLADRRRRRGEAERRGA